jgi:hypothetical protein
MLLGLDLFGDKLLKAEGWDGDLRHKPASGSTADRSATGQLRYTGAYKACRRRSGRRRGRRTRPAS